MFVDITDISRFQESRRPWVASEIFDERLRFMQKADKLGYTNFWFAEHHFHDNHPLSVPNLMLAAASQLTERLRLGLMVNVLPFHHPLRVAEESTILDHLSHGRFDLGVGRGIQKLEYDGWDIPMEESWPRFQECLDVIMRLLRDEKVTHHGQYYN
ncbi:MAG: LLM class flavin-dependent oxidoreductase, partial [Chloroflexi bacterium]|nr:LLM class flavin-dependent oxidoreductase [Chloroflexota bacterium]